MAVRRYTGADAALKDLEALERNARPAFGEALLEETQTTLVPEARTRAPFETGELRSSIQADGPSYQGKKVQVALVATAPHALYVHEDLEAEHATGEAKFIERTLKAHSSRLPAKVGKRIELKTTS